ncbi:UDP-4-amino-4,6-dideoxy-N-acetyl-beta-L-altrosamine N-acetyltransferase [Microbulbifer discodermiae]|uniref:UDP-4-amino-4, 6-dideoxy-N-acetyl-beta-L-altrosamine N-acetyltransferase n=1 Tax=Microbulbifer sp. 2201CG32-9 TaxID=3232309 RepID=UPI00345B675B
MTAAIVRKMRKDDLEKVLLWRNDREVRKYMYSAHVIGPEEHSAWFNRVEGSPDFHALIFEFDGKPTGFVKIVRLRGSPVADWGFYLAPGARRGAGKLLGRSALSYGFKQLGLHKLCGQVLQFNERSIRLHKKLGFSQEGVLKEHYFDGSQYYSVICLRLLRDEWESIQEG